MESDKIRFTNDELVQAFFSAQATSVEEPGILRTEELCDILGLQRGAVLRRVKILLKAGIIEVVDKHFTDIMGRQTKTKGYRLKE